MTSIKSKTNAICLAICGMLPALLLSGCSELDEQPQGLEDISLPVSLQRSANDALRIAQSLRRQSSTRLNGPEDETTVAPILSTDLYPDSVLLETQMVDTVLYVVNFNSNGGFYLVSGDLRMTEVLGFSDTGSLDLDEGTADASVPMLRAMLSDYCLSITEEHPALTPITSMTGGETSALSFHRHYPRKLAHLETSLQAWSESSPTFTVTTA